MTKAPGACRGCDPVLGVLGGEGQLQARRTPAEPVLAARRLGGTGRGWMVRAALSIEL